MDKFRLLNADEIECRVALAKETGVSLLLYKDARCDMRILDETVGAMNWQKSYSRDNRNCTVSIWDENKNQWISKEDTGTESNTEAEKGLASDSFKRACFNWGIGRELYTAPFIWVNNTSCKITGAGGKYKCFDKFVVTDIEYDENERISKLVIRNESTKEYCYTFSKKAEPKKEEPKKGLSKTKITALTKMLSDAHIDPIFVCKCAKVNSLAELTEQQHAYVASHTEELRKKYDEWKSKQS